MYYKEIKLIESNSYCEVWKIQSLKKCNNNEKNEHYDKNEHFYIMHSLRLSSIKSKRDSIIKEIKLLNELKHPNIVIFILFLYYIFFTIILKI